MMFSFSHTTHTSRYEISDLPQEILPHIFKYLSTDERKAAKLVCQSWLQACSVPSLLDGELLICLGINKLSDTYELLDRSHRGFLSLKFEMVKFVDKSSFWEDNGHRIRFIDFVNCKFPIGTLEKIIVHCVNLIHLSFEYTREFAVRCTSAGFPINEKDLDSVLRSGIVRENLESLAIIVRNPDRINVSNYFVHQLFSVYPKVKKLQIKCYNYLLVYPGVPCGERTYEEIDLDLSMSSEKDRFTFSPVLKYLTAAAERLEKLTVRFTCAQFPMNVLHPTFFSMKRLKRLAIYMGSHPVPADIDPLIQFSKQLDWLALDMDSMHAGQHYQSVVFQKLLANSSLKFLKIEFHHPLVFSKTIFEELISSGLKSLHLVVPSIDVENPDSLSSLLAQNNPTALPSLRLRCTRDLYGDGLSFCVRNFQHLYHLNLFSISDSKFFESLSKFKMKLKVLSLGFEREEFYMNPPNRFKKFRNRFNQLTDIEYLYLRDPAGDIFLKCLSPEPILANLKYLFIPTSNEAFTVDFLRAANVMPFLEGLRIYNWAQDVTFDFFLQLCRKLNRLRYFYYDGRLFDGDQHSRTNENYRELFSTCPSLRVFKKGFVTYFFDTFKNRVRVKRSVKLKDEFIVFRQPKIGKLPFGWLQ